MASKQADADVQEDLETLRRGQRWLAGQYGRVLNLRARGFGSNEELLLLKALDKFDDLERKIRRSGYQVCVSGEERCPADSPVACDACDGHEIEFRPNL